MNKDYYDILGISSTASHNEIKKAYRKCALQYHPDKNPSPEAVDLFKLLSEAYRVLNDPEKRKEYDQNGMNWLNNGGQNGAFHFQASGANPFFNNHYYFLNTNSEYPFSFFNGPNSPTSSFFTMPLAKDPPVHHDLSVSLEEIDKGCVKKMKVSRNVVNWFRAQYREEKVLTIVIKPGTKEGTKFIFHGEGERRPESRPGDIIFVIQDEQHPIFQRDGCHLHCTAQVKLKYDHRPIEVEVPTLNGGKVVVGLAPQSIVYPSSVVRIPNEGLPLPNDPTRRGDLIVSLNIQLPHGPYCESNNVMNHHTCYDFEWYHNEMNCLSQLGLY